MLLNNEWVNNEIKEEIKSYLETSENENTMFQNLWDIEKAILKEKFIALQAYLKKQQQKNISNRDIQKMAVVQEEVILTYSQILSGTTTKL